MRTSERTRLKAAEAARIYARNKNLSATARELGIHRSTLDRWNKEGLLDESAIIPTKSPDLSLDFLVTKALAVIDRALDGDAVKPQQIRSAIEVIKGSNALRAQAKVEEAKQSLAELIAIESDSD